MGYTEMLKTIRTTQKYWLWKYLAIFTFWIRPLVLYCLWVFKMFKRTGERKRQLKTPLRRRKLTGVRMEACTLVLLMKSLLPNYVKKHNMFVMSSVQLQTGAKERQSKHAERKKASIVGGKKRQRVGGRISYQAILLREKKICYYTHILMRPLL